MTNVPASELKLILNAHTHVEDVQFNAGGYVFTYKTGQTLTFTESQYQEHLESAKILRKHYSHLCAKSFPDTVSLYPVMAIAAARRASRVGGGYRLYVLAKALDRRGLGSIQRDELREYVLSLGASPRQWLRWITEARQNDLVRDWQKKTGEWMLALPNPGAAAFSIGGEVGNRKATMKASDLIGYGWKARIWAAYDALHDGRPISRERMQKIVNVPVSTQRYRDAQAGVVRQQNHAKLKAKSDALPGMLEYGTRHKGLYIRKDGYIGSRKPDSRFTDLAYRAGKGRARKANATLHRIQQQNGLSQVRQAFSDDVVPELDTNQSVYIRQFNYTHDQRKATEKKIVKLDVLKPPDVYEFSHTSQSGSVVWMEC